MLFSSSFYICLAGSALPGKFVRKLVIIPRKSRLKGRGLVFFDYNFPIIPSLGFYTPPTGLVEETLVPQWSTAVCILWSRPWILWSGVNTRCSMTRFCYHLFTIFVVFYLPLILRTTVKASETFWVPACLTVWHGRLEPGHGDCVPWHRTCLWSITMSKIFTHHDTWSVILPYFRRFLLGIAKSSKEFTKVHKLLPSLTCSYKLYFAATQGNVSLSRRSPGNSAPIQR